ncbi:Neurofilament light polypeptide, partial [Ophiophagus hannah]
MASCSPLPAKTELGETACGTPGLCFQPRQPPQELLWLKTEPERGAHFTVSRADLNTTRAGSDSFSPAAPLGEGGELQVVVGVCCCETPTHLNRHTKESKFWDVFELHIEEALKERHGLGGTAAKVDGGREEERRDKRRGGREEKRGMEGGRGKKEGRKERGGEGRREEKEDGEREREEREMKGWKKGRREGEGEGERRRGEERRGEKEGQTLFKLSTSARVAKVLLRLPGGEMGNLNFLPVCPQALPLEGQ